MATQITLPRDAEGREIPLDVEFLYGANGKLVKPFSFTFNRYDNFGWEMHLVGAPNLVYDPKSFYLTKPDSWKRLLDDLDNAAEEASNSYVNEPCCAWFNSGGSSCAGCPADEHPNDSCNVQLVKNIAARIRRLIGEERNDG